MLGHPHNKNVASETEQSGPPTHATVGIHVLPEGQEDVVPGLSRPHGMALDWLARQVYWTDYGTNTIEMARLDGTSRRVLIDQNLDWPLSIALDSASG